MGSACIGIEVNPDEDRCIAYVEYQGADGTATAEVTQQCANLKGNLWVPRSTIEYTGGITHSSGKYLTHTGDCYSFERDASLELDECISVCDMNTCEEGGHNTMSSDQMLSCTNACFMRHIGVSNGECMGHCDRHGQSGCFLTVNDVDFVMCDDRDVRGSPCTDVPLTSVSDCELGCNSYSEVPTTTLQPTAEPTKTPTLQPTMAYDCTVEVFKSFPDNSESELVFEENTWIDLSLEGISSLIVTGTCSVTVRDEDENVLATYTEGTYICCGAAADQTRFPNAQGLTWNDKIRSVYLYSTLGVESTEDWNFVNEDSTSYSVSLFSADERELLKSGDFEMQRDLSFRLQRDDSKSYSTFTYLDLETKTVHTQKMRGGYQNHQRFEMPSCTQITCHHHEKSASCPWTSKNAILLAVDFRPRSGNAYLKQWNRNRFTFTGTHYYATPTTENRRRLQAGSSLERLMKRFI